MTSAPFDPAGATACQTAAAIAAGRISALEACEAAIARIERFDPGLNAVVVRDFDRARAQARELDASPESPGGPLRGAPITVKEAHDIAGLATTWGLVPFKDFQPKEDSLAVRRLKAAGCVILGKTNVPPALADWQSDNPIYGRTLNPYDKTRTPGGSSGGSAAALAAGMVPLEFGSDIGGSIRVPAHFCGVFGHKPTYDLIPADGHIYPGTDGIRTPLGVIGPMARSAEDLAAAFAATAGPRPGSGYAMGSLRAAPATLAACRFLVLVEHPLGEVDAAVRGPIEALAAALERHGAKVARRHADLPDLAAAHRDYIRMLNTAISRGAPGARPIDAHAYMDLIDAQDRLVRQWGLVFADVDAVLSPPFGTLAFPHMDAPDWSIRRLMINGEPVAYGDQLVWPGLATFPGLPSTAAPIALSPEGLPTGVQIIAAPYGDLVAIGIAGLLEAAGLAGRQVCPGPAGYPA